MKGRRLFSAMLAFCLALSLAPPSAGTARAAVGKSPTVIMIASSHDGDSMIVLNEENMFDTGECVALDYEASTNVLSFGNTRFARENGSYPLSTSTSNLFEIPGKPGKWTAFYADGDLTIEFGNSTNEVIFSAGSTELPDEAYGIYVDGNLTLINYSSVNSTSGVGYFSPDCNVSFRAPNAVSLSAGIYCTGALTIKQKSPRSAMFSAIGGTVTAENGKSFGALAKGSFTVSDGAVFSARGGDAAGKNGISCGILADGENTAAMIGGTNPDIFVGATVYAAGGCAAQSIGAQFRDLTLGGAGFFSASADTASSGIGTCINGNLTVNAYSDDFYLISSAGNAGGGSATGLLVRGACTVFKGSILATAGTAPVETLPAAQTVGAQLGGSPLIGSGRIVASGLSEALSGGKSAITASGIRVSPYPYVSQEQSDEYFQPLRESSGSWLSVELNGKGKNASAKITGSVKNGFVTYGVSCVPLGSLLLVARYDAGRLSSVQSISIKDAYVDALGTASPDGSGSNYKLLLVNARSFAPLCPALDITG
ncbi:MAG: hypothetical protein IJU66_00770 [Oscillospiraceae bacterium]|nr:hypothetical protein [Oscillospiraceae bacterium]